MNQCGILESQPFENNRTCSDLVDDFTCQCLTGYTGTICVVITSTDDCNPNSCENNGTCNDLVDDFSCKCAADLLVKSAQRTSMNVIPILV